MKITKTLKEEIKEFYEEERRNYEWKNTNNDSRSASFQRMCAYGVCLDIIKRREKEEEK